MRQVGRCSPHSVRVFAAIVLGCLGIWGACGTKADAPIRKLLIDVSPTAQGPGGELSREKVREISQAFLFADGRFSMTDKSGEEGGVLRVRLDSYSRVVVPKKGPALHLSLAMEWSAPASLDPSFHFQAHSFVEAEVETSPAALLQKALLDCVEQLQQAHAAREQPSEALVSWLNASDVSDEKKREAIRVLGARGDITATEPLISILKGSDEALASAALGALTRLGNSNAVDDIIDYAERKPPAVRKQAIEAIRTLGTPKGRAWLFTLSTGHRHPDVRASAAHALAELEAADAPSEQLLQPSAATNPK